MGHRTNRADIVKIFLDRESDLKEKHPGLLTRDIDIRFCFDDYIESLLTIHLVVPMDGYDFFDHDTCTRLEECVGSKETTVDKSVITYGCESCGDGLETELTINIYNCASLCPTCLGEGHVFGIAGDND